MVAPVRIDWKTNLGIWYEGYVGGYPVDLTPQLTCTDFRGYKVSPEADNPGASKEQERYTRSLYDYYEIGDVQVDTANIRYAFKEDKVSNHNVIIDDSASPNWMSGSRLYDLTNGNIDYSMQWRAGTMVLVFFNNGGSNVEKPVRVKVPVSMKYGFGTISADLIGWIYPRQKATP